MKAFAAVFLLGCSHEPIKGEPDGSTPSPDAGPADASPIEAAPDASADGGTQGAGYTLTMVTCADGGAARFTALATPGKLMSDLAGAQACVHTANATFPNGAILICGNGVIIKDGEIATYCTGNQDYVVFAVPK